MPKSNEGPRVCLSEDQKLLLTRWIFQSKEVLFGRHNYATGVTNKAKTDCWTDIHQKAVAAGFPVASVKHTRETLWDNIRRNSVKKVQQSNQTGEGGSARLSPLDDAVLDVIGRESVYLKGTDLPDDLPIIPKAVTNPPSNSSLPARAEIVENKPMAHAGKQHLKQQKEPVIN